MIAELTADERAWLDACPLGQTRSVTVNGRKYEVARPACGVTFGGEAIKRDAQTVSVPQPPVDASREPAPWETTGVPIHGWPVDR